MTENKNELSKHQSSEVSGNDTITLGGGCFWCIEAVFNRIKGIHIAEVGYSGGEIKNPTYREVSSGKTEHVEVARIIFDPELISLESLLKIFFLTHDPTTINRQGADVGSQYRSVVFYHNEVQKGAAEKVKKWIDESGEFENPVVTAIKPLKNYYPAENYHQEYYKNNPDQAYCTYVIRPKVEKLKRLFKEHLKTK